MVLVIQQMLTELRRMRPEELQLLDLQAPFDDDSSAGDFFGWYQWWEKTWKRRRLQHLFLLVHDQSSYFGLELQLIGGVTIVWETHRPFIPIFGFWVAIHHLTWMIPRVCLKLMSTSDVFQFPMWTSVAIWDVLTFRETPRVFGSFWPQKPALTWVLRQFLEATAELLSYLEVSNLDLHPEDVEEAPERLERPGSPGAWNKT